MLISALFLLVLLVMILLFSALTFALLCPCSVYQSVGQVSKFSIAAAHKVDVVGESLTAFGPSTKGDGGMVVVIF